MIPEDWEVLPFDSVFRKVPSKAYQIQTSDYRETGLYPVIDQGQKRIVGYSDRAERLFETPEGGIIVFGDHTCIVKLVLHDFIVGADGTQILVPKPGHLAFFHNFALEHREVDATGYNRHFKFLKQRLFQSPPPPEQRAIAAALSDADALIAAFEAMIAKKRDLKQAAMQQLLTGKTRLPGFSGEWQVKRLGELLTVRHGRSQKEVEVAGGRYPILATGGEIGRTNSFLYDKPSVLIGRKGTIDDSKFVETPFWTVDTLFYTEIAATIVPSFIYFKFLMINWRRYNEASGVPSLSSKTIENIEVFLPPTFAEQTAIAEVLSDMDADLAALGARLAKARAVKQGMMQQLLTGKVRLV